MNAKEFDGALESILNDKVSPPNLEAVGDASEALVLIRRATGKMHKPYQITIGQQLVWYPKIFCCSAGMASRFDGSGVILSDLGVHKFTMCDHDYDKSGARHERGWHPAVCRKCGFDASIDSGD